MKNAEDVWACTSCRSINPRRADRCYRCHTPRNVGGVRPAEMPVTERSAGPVPTGTFRSSGVRAVLVTLATLLFIGSTALALWMVWTIDDLRAAGEAASADRLLQQRLPFLVAALACAGLALVAYAAWISRVVDNLPTLGLGYSHVGPTMAFIEPFIPGMNLYALPARTGEVVHKLEGAGTGLALIGLACLLTAAPAVVAIWILRIGRFTETGAEFLRTIGATVLGMFAFQAVALLIGLAVIWRVERLCRARARASEVDAAG